MAHSNGKITKPDSLPADVYPVLGIGPVGGKYDAGYACSNAHGKTAKWSKRKPICDPRFRIDHTDEPEWWKGPDGQCGITIPFLLGSLNSIGNQGDSALKDKYDNGNADWVYNPPKGKGTVNNIQSPFRIDDFEGYNHNANTPPIFVGECTEKVLYGAQSEDKKMVKLTCGFATATTNGADNLTLDDMTFNNGLDSLNQYILGFAVYDGTTYKGYAIGANAGAKECSFDAHLLPKRHSGSNEYIQYKIYPFLAKTNNANNTNTFITLPGANPVRSFIVCTFHDYYGLQVILSAHYWYMVTGDKAAIWWTLKVATAKAQTLKVRALLRLENKDYDDNIQDRVESWLIGNNEVPAVVNTQGGEDNYVVLADNTNVTKFDKTKEYKILVRIQVGEASGNYDIYSTLIKQHAPTEPPGLVWPDEMGDN